jgi:capsular polysaccharide biosynthesis protein
LQHLPAFQFSPEQQRNISIAFNAGLLSGLAAKKVRFTHVV